MKDSTPTTREVRLVALLAFVALLLGLIGWGLPSTEVDIGPLSAQYRGGIYCSSGSPATGDCVRILNGGKISVYSDNGVTRKFYVDNLGNVTAAGDLTVTNLISQTTGYALGNGTVGAPSLTFSSDTDTGLYRIGANNIGIATNGALIFDCSATGCTNAGTLNMGNQVISNIGNAGTDFNASGGLTVADGFTATQNVLSLGGQTFTGAAKWGTAATYTQGASITHGFSVTPTVCFINPVHEVTATYTITTTGFSSNMSGSASPIYWFCGK